MAQVTTCRACLVENLTLYRITNSPYEEIYEKLTNAKVGKVYPDTFCYICISVLRKFKKFATLAQHSNIKLKQWYKSEIDSKPTTQPLFTISTTTVEYVAMMNNDCEDKVQVKVESVDDTAYEDTNQIQYIEYTKETDTYIPPEEVNIIDPHMSGNDSQSDAYLQPGAASDDEYEVPVVKQEPRKRPAKTEKTPRGRPGVKKGSTKRNNENKNQNVVEKKNKKAVEKKNKKVAEKNNKKLIEIKEKSFSCHFCDYKAHRRCSVLHHLQKKHENKEISVEDKGQKHIALKTPLVATDGGTVKSCIRRILCDFCDYGTQKALRLKIHMKNKHSDIELTCKFCNYEAYSQTDLFSHKIKHHIIDKEFICDICGFITCAKSNVEKHMQIHSEKKIKCKFCNYKCSRNQNLAHHVAVVHSKDKKYMCHICHYRCSVSSRLYTHLNIHKTNDERKLKCEYCEKRFTRKQHLIRHIRIHTGEKPFACPECGQKFNQDSAMKLHLKRHFK